MKIRRGLPGVQKVFYYTVVFALVAGIMIIANSALFLGVWLLYSKERTDYVSGEEILKELTVTDEGYVLSDSMQIKLEEMKQWAILLDENGNVVWSYDKPEDIKEFYSQAEIARMSRWYL